MTSPLLVAVLAAVAQADGDAPSLGPAPAGPGAEIAACIAAHPGPATPPPNLAAEEASCRGNKSPPASCDGTGIITPEAAVCIAKTVKTPAGAVDDGVTPRIRALWTLTSAFDGKPYPGGLAWAVQYGANIGDIFVDAHTGEPLMASCCKGRPCSMGARAARARAVSRVGWS